MDEQQNHNGSVAASAQLTVQDIDLEFLPLIYEILRSIEKDPHDSSQKVRESQDISQKILELQKKLDTARTQVQQLPGVEYSKEDQLKKLETLRKQLQLKKDLLLKYRHMCSFEVPNCCDLQVPMVLRFLWRYLANNEQLVNRLAESYPVRRAAQWAVYVFTAGRNRINSDSLRSFAQRLQNELGNARKEIQEEMQKKQRK